MDWRERISSLIKRDTDASAKPSVERASPALSAPGAEKAGSVLPPPPPPGGQRVEQRRIVPPPKYLAPVPAAARPQPPASVPAPGATPAVAAIPPRAAAADAVLAQPVPSVPQAAPPSVAGKPAAPANTPRKPASRADVIEVCRRDELQPLLLGRFIFWWIEGQQDRGVELRALKADLVAAQLATHATRLDRFLCLYWIAARLGWDEAQQLRVSRSPNCGGSSA